eukprot:1386700-Prymnesium_polylepis.1
MTNVFEALQLAKRSRHAENPDEPGLGSPSGVVKSSGRHHVRPAEQQPAAGPAQVPRHAAI